ncbi:MAG: N-6 DNA methylase [Candidatus Lokiarchaeota archaeon]|nr:N-6 DNA methylase [Candidatus Lokiarchaeota archaeon]
MDILMETFKQYFKALQSFRISEITEHTHRSHLQDLLTSISKEIDKKITIQHEPKREKEFGAPDFKVSKTESIIGYVENKKIEENLDKIIKSDQIKRYTKLSDNIILTNYIEWIWIREGKILKRETLCYLNDIENKRAKLDGESIVKVERLIKSFLSQPPMGIGTAKKLSEAMAVRAKILKEFLRDEILRQEKEHTEGKLYGLYQTFKTYVFSELSIDEFADAFAQNLVYGLFLAKLNADVKKVSLYNAKQFIPSSFELIKELVDFLDVLDQEEYVEVRWIVEEVLTIMNNLDLGAIQKSLSFQRKAKSTEEDAENFSFKDPYVYFYEDFLAAYDKKLRKSKGVYYTPPPVVNFIIRAIDDILVNTFGIKDGFADHKRVTVLDFATGTGTFILEILKQIFEKLPADSGKRNLIIKEHVLKNIYGFEYLIAPYTIAHLKLSQYLKDQGYELSQKERFQIFLTNTLEPVSTQERIPLLPALSQETTAAQKVKDKPILVITGNPPYSYVSKNNGEWIQSKIKDYYFVDGKPLGEKNPKGLRDDYVKFIRFSQDKMEKVEEGIVGIITNHSYLDNPTYRGMREKLLSSFDQIFIIDLHGNYDKKEITPDGRKDENVFDIKTGVAITILIKNSNLKKCVKIIDFWGNRKNKYTNLLLSELPTLEWAVLNPKSPFYLFKEQNTELFEKYKKYISVKEIFKISQEGIKTHRDHFAIDIDKNELRKRITEFRDLSKSDLFIRDKFKLRDNRDWKLELNRNKLSKLNKDKLNKSFCLIQYRPFDNRYICYRKEITDWPRKNTMRHMLGDNIGLIGTRFAFKKQLPYTYCFITDNLLDVNHIQSPGSAQLFPLYYYENPEGLFAETDEYTKQENFRKSFRSWINHLYKKSYIPENILAYIYGILHSNIFREKYGDFLKIDFPRIPFTDSQQTFEVIADKGWELIQAHLMNEIPEYDLGYYKGKGNNEVIKPDYRKFKDQQSGNQQERLYINKTQYFDKVPEEVYNFYIGGYQVLDKYLKDRKGRTLSLEEIENIENVVKILAFTIDQMKVIDDLTRDWI